MRVQVVTIDGMEEVFQVKPGENQINELETDLLEQLDNDQSTITIKDSKHTLWFPKQQIIRVRISG